MKARSLILLTEDSAVALATRQYRSTEFSGPKEFKSDLAKIRRITEELQQWNLSGDVSALIRVANTVMLSGRTFPADTAVPLLLFFNDPRCWSQIKTIACYCGVSSRHTQFNLNGVEYGSIPPDLSLLTALVDTISHE